MKIPARAEMHLHATASDALHIGRAIYEEVIGSCQHDGNKVEERQENIGEKARELRHGLGGIYWRRRKR